MSPRCRAALFAAATLAACQPTSRDVRVTDPPLPLTGAAHDPMVLASATSSREVSGEVAAPWSLTASDGSGLTLSRVEAHAVVEGPLAFTELHLYFHNPEARVREGTFAITLPPGAALSRFAMEQNGKWQEAEVVETQLAHRAYEDFLHRRQDPALLEKAAGNQFQARVFPIAANADKHLVISFSQEVVAGQYILPLRGLAEVPEIAARVDVARPGAQFEGHTLAEHNWKPDRDLVVATTTTHDAPAIAADGLVAARVKIALPSAADVPSGVTVLVDTSASRALGFAAQARTVRGLVTSLATRYGAALPVQVVAFDQDTVPVFDGRADGFDDHAERALLARGALGASDLGQALTWVGAHGAKSRVIIVSDGMVTAGADAAALPAIAKQLAARKVDRIDLALTGGIRDNQLAASIAQAGLPHTGAVLDLDGGIDDVATRVGLAVQTHVPIAVDGATWTFPREVAAAQSGDEVTVYARLARPSQHIAITVGGVAQSLAPIAVERVLLGRALAGAEITELEGELATATGDARTALKADIVKRSIAARVVSSQTAMLVLESDADFARYGIDRNALADILVASDHGVALAHRAAPAQIAVPVQPQIAAGNHVAPKVAVNDTTQKEQLDNLVSEDPDKDEAKKSDDGVAMALDEGKVGKGADQGGDGAPEASDAPAPSGVLSGRGHTAVATAIPPAMPPPPPTPAPAAGPAPQPPAPMERNRRVRAQDLDDDVVSGSLARPAARFSGRGDAVGGMADDGDEQDSHLPDMSTPALTGPLADIMGQLKHGNIKAALAAAIAWHDRAPGDVLGLLALGESREATKDLAGAARAYGSIIDLYPARADFRRFAGERLERVGASARALAIDTYRKAVEERADHLTGHRLLAYALLRAGDPAGAFDAIIAGLDRDYPPNRFAGGKRVLAEDAGMIGAALIAKTPSRRADVLATLTRLDAKLPTGASTRFILYWETDDNDVDFHIQDARGGHAYYGHKQLRSGGALYEDITTGYGPECFTIEGRPTAGPYRLSINYFSQGPMGYGMGLLEIVRYDGKGGLVFDDRPYVIMTDHAYVDLGTFKP